MYLNQVLSEHRYTKSCCIKSDVQYCTVRKRAEKGRLRLMKQSPSSQQGSMIVMALFIIVVLGLLSAALIKIISTTSDTTIAQVYGVRAQQAAQSGIQGLLQSSFPAGNNATLCNTTITQPTSFSTVAGFQSCGYEARCESQIISFANVDYLYFKFTSTGFCTVNEQVVSRTISVDASEEIMP